MTRNWVYCLSSEALLKLILKGYLERRYPSVNQVCTEVKYKMPEQEDEEVVVEEESDEGDGSFKKVLDWMERSMKNINKTENTMNVYSSMALNTESKLFKYLIGNNKMGQAIALTSPLIFTMKRKKVGCIYCN